MSVTIQVLCLCILIFPFSLFGDSIFIEEFTDNGNNWPEDDDEYATHSL